MSLDNFEGDNKSYDSSFSSENTSSDNNEPEKETSFIELADAIKNMGKLFGSVSTDLNKSLGKIGDIFSQFGESLGDGDKSELHKLFLSLSRDDKEELLKLVNDNNKKGIRFWLEQRCDNENLINTIMSSTDIFKEALNMKNKSINMTKEVANVFGQIFPGESNKFSNVLGGLIENFEENFPFVDNIEKTETDDDSSSPVISGKISKESDNKDNTTHPIKDHSDNFPDGENTDNEDKNNETKSLGENLLLSEIRKMKSVIKKILKSDDQPEDQSKDTSNNIYQSVVNAFKNIIDEDDEDAFDEITDTIDNMVGTIEETFTELNNTENENNQAQILQDGLVKILNLDEEQLKEAVVEFEKMGEVMGDKVMCEKIRQGLIDDTANMITRHNKLSDDINNIATVLTPLEIKLLEIRCGELPLNFRLRMMENKLNNLDIKLTQSIENTEPQTTSISEFNDEKLDELGEKIDDIALNLDLLLTKLSRLLK